MSSTTPGGGSGVLGWVRLGVSSPNDVDDGGHEARSIGAWSDAGHVRLELGRYSAVLAPALVAETEPEVQAQSGGLHRDLDSQLCDQLRS